MSGISLSFKSNLNTSKIQRKLEKNATKAVQKALNRLKAKSLEEVPRDTGALAESCTVETDGKEGTISYGTEYAVIQHERTDFAHPSGGKAKYLEDPMNDPVTQSAMLNDMAEAMRF